MNVMMPELNLKEKKYANLRRNLDELGYHQSLGTDSLHLVEALLSDLLHTTESLRHYKELAQKTLEEHSALRGGIEPYKKENAKLVKEVNELYSQLVNQKEEADKTQRELQKRISRLESDCSDLQFLASQHLATVKTLEKESAAKTQKILQLQRKGLQTIVSTPGGKRKLPLSHRQILEIDAPLKPRKNWREQFSAAVSQAKDPKVIDTHRMALNQIVSLSEEVKDLRNDSRRKSETIGMLKEQLANRGKEIERLSQMLDGGRSLKALRNDCASREAELRISKLSIELQDLETANKELEERLKESLGKQHEAMTRAVKLAERNKHLEQELRDIDHIALAVEEECNSTVKENSRRVSKIQERLDASLAQVRDLEREVLELKRNEQEAQADVESAKKDTRHAQRALEKAQSENRRLSEKVNNLLVIEHDLNKEIDRINKENASIRQKLIEFENRQAPSGREVSPDERSSSSASGGPTHRMAAERDAANLRADNVWRTEQEPLRSTKSNGATESELAQTVAKQTEVIQKLQSERDRYCLKNEALQEKLSDLQNQLDTVAKQKELIQKLQSERDRYCLKNETLQEKLSDLQNQLEDKCMENGVLEQLQTEKDYYKREYEKLREKQSNADAETASMQSLRRRLQEQDKEIKMLEMTNKELASEKLHLQTKIDALQTRRSLTPTQSPGSPTNGISVQTAVKRLEHERDCAKDDVRRLQEERDALRERLKLSTETQVTEHARLEKAVMDSEDRVRRQEAERRSLISQLGEVKAQVLTLRDEADSNRTKLRQAQTELTQQQALYNQTRNLQEQTDRSLSEAQGQLTQVRKELTIAQEHVRELERDRAKLDKEVAALKNERTVLRGSIAQLDQEKDTLILSVDSKTEKLAAIEKEVKLKDTKLLNLETTVTELQKKLDISLDETAARDALVRAAEREVNTIRSELEAAERARDGLLRENRRLQDDLASVTKDCNIANRELVAARDEADTLKRQLQDYVKEIKRIEDMLARKERERSEMLEQFRGLSLEAEALESNNHSLETEAQEQKSKLRLAEDRIAELEGELETRDSLVHSYESQLAELTGKVAGFETQIRQHTDKLRRAEADLVTVRDLCVTLDSQKEALQEQAAESDEQRIKLEREVCQLRKEVECLQVQLSKEQATVVSLEEILDSSRQEALRFRRSSQDAECEVTRLRQKVSDLQADLDAGAADLRRYQTQAAEYSRQVADLQRQITNERFERARMLDESRSYSTL
ncbi:centrosomal protein of 135 kDa isoform X2 [Schistocerca gregaria]|uniref:centrosomal protein of 135 kDa isoform X2 n=1 Tax=Schistocerca gregaria TaxID=7010 RepID=UPI00211EC4F0|nr:centrosomal protein of 135 kDa isoform X2 [Schistocerca gregaria]